MKGWLRNLLIVVAVLALSVGAYAVFTMYSNGNDVNLVLHVGTLDGGAMYLRCTSITGNGASCDQSDQANITVHKRDKLHITIVDDQGGGHRHDFNVRGWQYYWPDTPETELNAASESVTFTTWATGEFHILCELPGHDARGMHGTLVVA